MILCFEGKKHTKFRVYVCVLMMMSMIKKKLNRQNAFGWLFRFLCKKINAKVTNLLWENVVSSIFKQQKYRQWFVRFEIDCLWSFYFAYKCILIWDCYCVCYNQYLRFCKNLIESWSWISMKFKKYFRLFTNLLKIENKCVSYSLLWIHSQSVTWKTKNEVHHKSDIIQ